MSITTASPATRPSRGTTRVPRENVHKTVESEVLLTACRPLGNDTYSVTARWPNEHTFYGPSHGLHDPLLIAESVRQAIPLLCHTAYDVPHGHRQGWNHFRYTLNPQAMTVTTTPTPIHMHITCTDITRRANRLASMNMHITLTRHGKPLAHAHTSFYNQPPALYQRLRKQYADLTHAHAHAIPPTPPLHPHHVNRQQPHDVVLSPTPTPNHTQLRIDLTHPILFDHPVDHAPGMLLLEATRQATHAHTHPQPTTITAINALFTRYAELDTPCWIHTTPLPHSPTGHPRLLTTAQQNNTTIYTSITTHTNPTNP